MKFHQKGFTGIQAVLALGVIVAISMVSIPTFNSFKTKAKIAEAMTIAVESKRKVSEFYTLNGRLPKSASESRSIETLTVSPPEYVQNMVVDTNDETHAVVIRVYLKEGVIDNPTGEDQFVYVAADYSVRSDGFVEWICGAIGLDSELMPEGCRG